MKKGSTQAKNIVSANFSDSINVQVDQAADYRFVQVNEFQPNVSGWNRFGNVSEYSKVDNRTILLKNAQQLAIQVTFITDQGIRVQFRPETDPDYSQRNSSYAVVNNKLSTSANLKISEIDKDGPTLKVESDNLTLYIGLQPYGMAIYQDGVLITEDCFGKNIIYSHEAVACLREAPENENYYGFGQKAGSQLNKKNFTMSCFNYDNFSYDGSNVIPEGNQPGPLNPSEPLYNSIPFMLAIGNHDQQLYSYGLFLDNVSQSYFNMGSNDYSDMTGKYYFGALYGDLDYYLLIGAQKTDNNPIRSVLNQYSELTGRSAMPPKYAFGYQQGCYGYYKREILMDIAKSYRDAAIPIDGLHIDVDFQNNYRTFTSSPTKFPKPKDMFYQLHKDGFKCSTNITGIISANPLDEEGNRDTPYPARDSFVSINSNNNIVINKAKGIPFLYNTRSNAGESPNLFIANESYGLNNGFNPFKYPTPLYPNGQNALGTYGFYCDLGQKNVQDWWGKQYDYLLDIGVDMIWQDMTCPAVVPNLDNDTPDKTLPLNLMMYDKVSNAFQPNAKVHNAFAINLIEATYHGISKIKKSTAFKGKYNYKKRNFIIARGGYAGVHRYAGVWTGDSASSWDFLKINIPEVLNFGLSGQPISGCDIGGFANGSGSEGGGVTNYELFTRWMTLGAFLPWYRNHYDGYTKQFQEPFRYGEPVPSNCRKYIEMRYRLIQVFYDAMYENTQNGVPIARALFVNDPHDPAVFEHCDDQFFVGNDLLVAPIVEANSVHRSVYLPRGSRWYVYSDNTQPLSEPTPGGTTQDWYVPLDLVPVYVREGAILPHRELEQYIGELAVNPITYNIYPGKDSTYTVYQDDQVSTDNIEKKAYRITTVSHTAVTGGQRIDIVRSYDNYTPPEKFYYISLLGVSAPTKVTAVRTKLKDAGSPEGLANARGNAYYYNESIKTTFIKVYDKKESIAITALFE